MAPEAGCTRSNCEVPGQRNGFCWRFQRGREGLEQHYGRAGSAAKRNPTKPLNLSFNEYAFFFFLFLLGVLIFSLKTQASPWRQCMETVFIRVTETLLFCQFSILLFASRHVCVRARARVQPVFLDGRKYLKILFQLVFPPEPKSTCGLSVSWHLLGRWSGG